MKLLILAAGHATRLRPLTDNCAKPLLPVRGRAIIDHLLDKFHDCGIEDVCVVTNGKYAHDFERWKKTAKHPFYIHILDDGTTGNDDRRGAIGDIAFALDRDKPGDDDYIVAAGDNLLSASLAEFARLGRSATALQAMLIGVYDVGTIEQAKKYGQVTLDCEGLRVLDLAEKPESPTGTMVSAGLYCLPRSAQLLIRQYINDGNNCDAPGHLIRWLIRRLPCYAYQIPGRWLDIGSKEAYDEAQLPDAPERLRLPLNIFGPQLRTTLTSCSAELIPGRVDGPRLEIENQPLPTSARPAIAELEAVLLGEEGA